MNRTIVVACAAWAIANAGCQRDGALDPPTPPTPPPPPPLARDAGPAMQKPTVDAGDLLRAFGQRTKARIAAEFPPTNAPPPADPNAQTDLPAIGACTRPTDAERAQIEKAIDRALSIRDPSLRFGCTQPTGTIVDVNNDTDAKSQMEWRVVRVHGADVKVLAKYRGTSMNYWSEWSDEETVDSLALVDLDGDGIADDVISKSQHEGGSQTYYITLSAWLSSTGKTTQLNAQPFTDGAEVGRQHYVAGAPLALVVTDHHHDEPTDYLCVIAGAPPSAPTLAPCQQGADVRAVDRGDTIADWFADPSHKYGPEETSLPDHDLLASLLDDMNAPAAERAPLLAVVPPTGVELQVATAIAAAVATDKVVFGERVALPQPPDTRAKDLMTVLGDLPCPAADGASKRAAIARVAAWIAKNDAKALATVASTGDEGDGDGEVANLVKTGVGRPSTPIVTRSCAAGGRGYYALTWKYTANGMAILRSALAYVDAHGLAMLTDATSVGQAIACNACGPEPQDRLDARFHRHGAALVALAIVRDDPNFARAIVSADGVTVPMIAPPVGARTAKWYRFAEPDDRSDIQDANDVVEIGVDEPTAQGWTSRWHWDGAWAMGAGSGGAQADAWMHDADARTLSLAELRSFSPSDWATSAERRVAILGDLMTIHADPALLARVTAAGASLSN